MNPSAIAHQNSGRRFAVGDLESFVLDRGDGDPVLLMHGVPASSYLYRKVVPALAERGLRGVAFDMPGLGLADRPEDFDYSWTGLGRFAADAVDALGLDRFHLVVHDIGGPVGFELAAAMPERVQSLTILNTMIEADEFKKPWSMRPFGVGGLNRLWLASTKVRAMFRQLMYMQGVGDRTKVSAEELDAYVDLLTRGDGGRAFLKIMTSFETTADKAALYRGVVTASTYPVQVVWGEQDPALRIDTFGAIAEKLAGVTATRLPGKHFFQEESFEALAQQIADFVSAPA